LRTYQSAGARKMDELAHHPTICSLVPFLRSISIIPCWKGMSTAI
jgi:hypothetical protein